MLILDRPLPRWRSPVRCRSREESVDCDGIDGRCPRIPFDVCDREHRESQDGPSLIPIRRRERDWRIDRDRVSFVGTMELDTDRDRSIKPERVDEPD